MSPPKCFLRCCFISLLLAFISPEAQVILYQTIPEDGLACPNERLQFTCIAPGNILLLEVAPSISGQFIESDSVNASFPLGDFVAVLVVQNETTISATITNERATSSDSGTLISCAGGSGSNQTTVTIAEKPASCNLSVVPVCQITTHAGNNSETLALISLSTSESLMCVVAYLIQFNGENRTVPVSSPSAEFSISITKGEPFDYEIIVHTLDYENRTGQTPCVFNSTELSVVKKFDYVPDCDPSLNLIVTFNWMEPSVLGACLVSDMPLQYMYLIEFSNSQFTTNSMSYQLMDVPQGIGLEIIITPALPSLELTGPPLATTVNLVGISCTPSSPSPGGPSENNVAMVVALIVVAVLLLLLFVVTVLFVVILFFCFRKKHRKDTRLMMSTLAVQVNPSITTSIPQGSYLLQGQELADDSGRWFQENVPPGDTQIEVQPAVHVLEVRQTQTDEDKAQKIIQALERKVVDLEEEVDELRGKNAEWTRTVEDQAQKIQDLERQLRMFYVHEKLAKAEHDPEVMRTSQPQQQDPAAGSSDHGGFPEVKRSEQDQNPDDLQGEAEQNVDDKDEMSYAPSEMEESPLNPGEKGDLMVGQASTSSGSMSSASKHGMVVPHPPMSSSTIGSIVVPHQSTGLLSNEHSSQP